MFVWAGFSAGCSDPRRVALLELEGVEAEAEPGEGRFVLHGRGFPTDRPARIELRGVVRRPGLEDSAVEVRVSGAAPSAETLEFSTDGSASLRALSPGQFEGSLEVAFVAGATEVRGQLDAVRLPLRSAQVDARRHALRAARRGSEWLASLGASELEIDLDRPGVRVGRVEQAGVADLAGLAPGDRIVALDGSQVGDLADLWPPSGAAPVEVRVERGAASREVELSLPRAHGQRVRAAPNPAWLGALLLLWLGALLVWPVRGRDAAAAQWRWVGLGLPLAACPLALAGFAAQLGGTEVHVLRGLVPAALLFAALPWLGPRARRAESLTRVGLQLAVAFVALATAGLLSGTLSPSLDRASPGEWPLLLQPPGWCLLGMAHCALRAPAAGVRARGLAAGVRGVVTAALVALCGGVHLLPALGPMLSLAVISLAVWLPLEWLGAGQEFSLGWLGLTAVAGPLFAFVWFFGVHAPVVSATLGALTPWALALSCARSAVVRARERFWPAPAGDPQLAPFL